MYPPSIVSSEEKYTIVVMLKKDILLQLCENILRGEIICI